MKYKLIVDKQSRTNPSADKREYEIDIEELRVKGDVYDSLVITVEETYIIRRLSLSEYQVLSVLNEPIKETLGDLNVQLFEGNNYIYLMDMTGNKFYAEYIIKNEFNNLYVTNAQMNSAINQTVSGIELSVNQKLTGYSTVADTANAKQEAIDNANADTDEKLKNYSTTKEMEASIDIKIDEVTTKVSRVETQVTTVEEKADKAQETADTLKTQTIQKVDVMYVLSNSSTEAPTSGWQTTAPAWENGKYMWQKTITTYGDGTTKESDATCITGATGATGKAGENGKDGENGNDGEKGDTGIGVKSIEEQYYLSTSNTSQTGGSWKTTQDTWTSEKYIWTRNKITWTDNTTTYTTAILATGLNNANSTANTANNTANTANTNAQNAKNTANTAKETADGVSENLKTNYYTKTETTAEIKTKADEITSNVSKTYSTKTETSNAKQEAINSANASTDEKLEDYSTTAEMNTVIKQTAESIGLSVDEKINSAIGTNYINNGTFENNLENWTSDTSGSTTGSVIVQENSGTKYAQIVSKGALTKLSQRIEGLKKDTEHTLIFNAYDNGDLEIDLEDGIFQVDIIQYKESSEEILEETSTRIYVSKESKTYEVKFTPTENVDVELIFSLKNPFVSSYSMSVMLTNIVLHNGGVTEELAKLEMESKIINLEVGKKVNNEDFTGANIILQINDDDTGETQINADKISLKRKKD